MSSEVDVKLKTMRFDKILSLLFLCFFSTQAFCDSIVRKVIERYEIPGTNDELQMILIEYPPGVAGPPHFHPVVGLNYIIEGIAESQYEGEPIKTFHSGDSYQDPANKRHVIFRNASKTKPLKFLVACKIPKGQSFSVKIAEQPKESRLLFSEH
ncbi:MAG: cupin domain-containing protein [bacterium]